VLISKPVRLSIVRVYNILVMYITKHKIPRWKTIVCHDGPVKTIFFHLFWRGSCFIHVICIYLHISVSNTTSISDYGRVVDPFLSTNDVIVKMKIGDEYVRFVPMIILKSTKMKWMKFCLFLNTNRKRTFRDIWSGQTTQWSNEKRTNNDLQRKLKIEQHEPH
jgi:hypothetical protein